jgi:hypothetical protein
VKLSKLQLYWTLFCPSRKTVTNKLLTFMKDAAVKVRAPGCKGSRLWEHLGEQQFINSSSYTLYWNTEC